MTARLFTPIDLGPIRLANRIVVSPMCQYQAHDGVVSDWHLVHLGSLLLSGAGLVILEAHGVTPDGRITPGCPGLYSDACEEGLARLVERLRGLSPGRLGIQLAHAGRKASAHIPWHGGKPLGAHEGAWQTAAPSALPFDRDWPTPQALDRGGLDRIRDGFAGAARRAARAGFDAVELHCSHGYLLHSFQSPVSNRRNDAYGGDVAGRLRFPLEVAAAVREAWPRDKALGARITGSDWMEGGLTVDDAVEFARRLVALGYDYVCPSSGGVSPDAKVTVGPEYQVPFSAAVRERAGARTYAVGMIVDPARAEAILASGQADMIGLARAVLDDPRWPWHAAEALGVKLELPSPYRRAHPALWPGAALRRSAG